MADSRLTEDIQQLRKETQTYTPGSCVACPDRISFPKKIFIGLFGQTGCGKTSLINSLKYVVMGELRRGKWLQVASQEKSGGHTMFRKLADLTKSIYVIDNRGLDNHRTEGAIEEIAAQLDGKRGYTDKVKWDGNSADELSDSTGEDGCKGHKISCAVFVFSAIHAMDLNTSALMDVVDFLHGHQGRYPVAVITHVDSTEKSKVETLKSVLKVSGVSDVFEVANVTEEKPKLEEVYQLNLLLLLERCMTDADETLVFKHYQECEEKRKAKIREKRLKKEREREQERKREAEARAEREKQEKEREREREKEVWRRVEATDRQRNEEVERLQKELERERDQMREQEREQRFQTLMQGMARDHREEIRRIMEANQRECSKRACIAM